MLNAVADARDQTLHGADADLGGILGRSNQRLSRCRAQGRTRAARREGETAGVTGVPRYRTPAEHDREATCTGIVGSSRAVQRTAHDPANAAATTVHAPADGK